MLTMMAGRISTEYGSLGYELYGITHVRLEGVLTFEKQAYRVIAHIYDDGKGWAFREDIDLSVIHENDGWFSSNREAHSFFFTELPVIWRNACTSSILQRARVKMLQQEFNEACEDFEKAKRVRDDAQLALQTARRELDVYIGWREC